MTSASEILREAADIVDGARGQTHGAKERNFQAIADLWNAYLKSLSNAGEFPELNPPSNLRAIDVAQMMVLLKVARSLTGRPITDHFTDMAGYAAIAGELGSND